MPLLESTCYVPNGFSRTGHIRACRKFINSKTRKTISDLLESLSILSRQLFGPKVMNLFETVKGGGCRLHGTGNYYIIVTCCQMLPWWTKRSSFHQHLRYCHNRSTIVFSVPSANIWVFSHIAGMMLAKVNLFQYDIHFCTDMHSSQWRAVW